jgi:hypothetical protein
MGAFGTWNPYTSYVNGGGIADGRFVSGGLILIDAGPRRLAELGGSAALNGQFSSSDADVVYPIAAIQNVNMSQNKTFMRVWELGSERSYFIGSRTVGQLALSRVYYHGPSMLRCLYAYYQDLLGQVKVPWIFENPGHYEVSNPHDVQISPGYKNLFINLASDMFNQPIGIMMYMRDSNLDTIGAIYLESVVVPNHTWATDAQGTIVQESVAMQYERVVPVAVQALALVTGSEEGVA